MNISEILADHIGTKHCFVFNDFDNMFSLAFEALSLSENDVLFVPEIINEKIKTKLSQINCHKISVPVCEDTYNIDPKKLLEAVKDIEAAGEYTPKAVIVSDMYGQPADYYDIKNICRDHKLDIFEDSCDSFGAAVDLTGDGAYKMACSYGKVAIASFDTGSPLSIEGGACAIFTDDDNVAAFIASKEYKGIDETKSDLLKIELEKFRGEAHIRKEVPFGSLLLARNQVVEWIEEVVKPLEIKGYKSHTLRKDVLSSWSEYIVKAPDGKLIRITVDPYMSRDEVIENTNKLLKL